METLFRFDWYLRMRNEILTALVICFIGISARQPLFFNPRTSSVICKIWKHEMLMVKFCSWIIYSAWETYNKFEILKNMDPGNRSRSSRRSKISILRNMLKILNKIYGKKWILYSFYYDYCFIIYTNYISNDFQNMIDSMVFETGRTSFWSLKS